MFPLFFGFPREKRTVQMFINLFVNVFTNSHITSFHHSQQRGNFWDHFFQPRFGDWWDKPTLRIPLIPSC